MAGTAFSLKGTLDHFFFASILQLLFLEKKSGVLRLRSALNEVKIFFNDGTIIYATETDENRRLINLLKHHGYLPQQQIAHCSALAKKDDVPLAAVLSDQNALAPATIQSVTNRLVSDILYDLFLWEHGEFEYSDGLPSLENRITTELDTMELILEASRRVDEISVLTRHFPSDRIMLKMSEILTDKKKITLAQHEWNILSLINGSRSIRQIIKESGCDEFSIYKILYLLLSSGLIETCGESPAQQHDADRHPDKGGEVRKKTILVADDMTQIRKILRFSLRQAGYDVMLAEDGEEALACACGDRPPDLIILDIMMPKLTGYDVVRRLRKSDRTMNIPVIFLTAKSQKEDVLKGLEAGADYYMVKPYRFSDLHKKIEALLDKSGSQQ